MWKKWRKLDIASENIKEKEMSEFNQWEKYRKAIPEFRLIA